MGRKPATWILQKQLDSYWLDIETTEPIRNSRHAQRYCEREGITGHLRTVNPKVEWDSALKKKAKVTNARRVYLIKSEWE